MFDKLIGTIEKFDLLNLIMTNSACQLMPVNSDKLMRFELMAFCLSSLKYNENRPTMSKSKLKTIYNSDLYGMERVSPYEDPFEQMFTESIAFYGGTYTVFPGITEDGTMILKHLLKAIFMGNTNPEYQQFYNESYRVTMLFLALSNAMALKAGLTYGEESKAGQKDIQLPSYSVEETLMNATTFHIWEIEELLKENDINVPNLDVFIREFTIQFGEVDIGDYTNDNHELHLKPFLRYKDKIVVTMPCNLLGTLRHTLIKLALKYSYINELKVNFEERLWSTVIESLKMMGIKKSTLSLPAIVNMEEHYFKEGLFTIDSDKVVYIQLHTDDFSDYNPRIVYDANVRIRNDYFEIRAIEAKQYLQKESPEIKEVFMLLLIQSAGRSMFLGLNKVVDEIHLTMSVSDLELVAFLEYGDSLHLYKYAKALNKLNSASRNFSMGFLDTYSIYRHNDYSFYLSDNEKPNIYYFSVGEGRDLIEEINRKVRPHGVLLPDAKGVSEVVSVYEDSTIPIFAPSSIYKKKISYVVEGSSWNVWITSSQLHEISAQFVDMISYWIWQFSPEIERLVKGKKPFQIEVNLYPFRKWIEIEPSEDNDSHINDEITYHIVNNTIHLNIHKNFTSKLEGSTNYGERELIKTILSAFQEMTDGVFSKPIGELIETTAPLGPKKKLLTFNQDNFSILLEPGIFPRLRFIDPAEENIILDDIGSWLRNHKKIGIGKIERPKEVINDIVGYLFKEIETIFENFRDPEKVLQTLMLYYEALIQKREEYRVTLTTTLHCFSNKTKMIEKINTSLNDFNKLSVSLRFLIEYVSACPPKNGSTAFSFAGLDRLLALSSLLIQWANNSDLINYQLEDLQVSMLPSQRLGLKHKNDYFSASTKYFNKHSSEVLTKAIEKHHTNWEENSHQNSKEVDVDLIEAFSKEFEIGFYDFFEFVANVFEIGRGISQEVKTLPLVKFKKILQHEYKMSESTIEKSLKILSLLEREKFLKPPKDFRNEDVLPWKFNRGLSYLRKPLIIQDNNIFWSNRHLHYTGGFLIDLCLGGRLKAKTLEMKNLISKYQNIKGDRFNKLVEDLFNQFEFLITKSQVKKFKNKKIEGNKGDLGDIDVLVINQRTKRVFVIECKDLSIARNPYEINFELKNMFKGTDKKASIVQKHQKRTDWIRNNLNLVLQSFNIPEKGKWKVNSLIVIDEEMVSPYLYKDNKGIRVISLNQLKEEIDGGKFFRK